MLLLDVFSPMTYPYFLLVIIIIYTLNWKKTDDLKTEKDRKGSILLLICESINSTFLN